MAQDECLGRLSCSMLGVSFFFFFCESVPVETGGANTASAGMQQESGTGAGFKSQPN